MKKLFGTDGVRGEANTELSPELAFGLGRAGAHVLTKKTHHAPKVIIGTDTRISCDMLECALAAGMCSLGAEVILAGVIPTPGIPYLLREYGLDAGVMISASHNPFADNGIKFFNNEGYKLSEALETEIEGLINNGPDALPRPAGSGVGQRGFEPDKVTAYIDFLERTLAGRRLDGRPQGGLRVVMDCANGATYKTAPEVFRRLGADVTVLHDAPDGENINAGCGSMHMESLSAYISENNADIGIAFDGDGDRMLAVDELGNLLDGDAIMAICVSELHRHGLLKKNTLVGTVMSNQGLDVFCREKGINLIRTDVGDRYVLKKMLDEDFNMGGEQSGHVIFRQFADTGDGILTGLQLVAALALSGQPLSELRKIITVYPQILVNALVNGAKKNDFSTHPAIVAAQAEIEANLADQGRILVRPSGTEPLVRVMIEGKNQAQITEWANELAQLIEENLN
jgi:phosphoglucosamine mutase